MMRSAVRVLFFVLALYAGVATGAWAAPQRIVSLDLCTDWMLARYADHAQVRALSPLHRQYPVAWIGSHWPVHDGTLEQLVALKPDLVMAGEYNAPLLRARLLDVGVRMEVLPLPQSLADIHTYERRVLALLGKPDSLASVEPSAVHHPSPRPRLLLLGPNGVGTGRGTMEHDILVRAGWDNDVQGQGYVQLDLERIVAHAPDAVLWAAPSSRALANRFAEHPVLKRAIPPSRWLTTDYWRWQCPGPWTWDLIRQLQQWRG